MGALERRRRCVGWQLLQAQTTVLAKLEVLIVAAGQFGHVDEEDNCGKKLDGVRKQELDEAILKQVDVVEVATAGEAWEQLTTQGRLTRWYQTASQTTWRDKFYEVDDDGNRILESGPESATASV